MSAKPKMSMPQGCTVWVWDSTWIPAVVVVGRTQRGFVLVRFEHGVTCSVAMSDLQPRDLTSRGNDRPISGRVPRAEPSTKRGQQSSPHGKVPRDRDLS
jgi:hypothetical protein